jgi:hypothetical protein
MEILWKSQKQLSFLASQLSNLPAEGAMSLTKPFVRKEK